MFCPKCSRQQISDNIRFCSGCGFQLSAVKALLADDASFSEASAPDRSRRKKDMTIGAVLMVFFALHSAWTTEDLSLEREYTSLIVKCFILCALINIIPKIFDFFRRNATRESFSSPKILSSLTAGFKGNDRNAAALPAAYSRPASDYFTGGINTAELIPPPASVTEKTTNLLRSDHY